MLHSIRETQSALAAIVSPEVRATPTGESLDQFLTRLPNRWRQDEETASRPKKVREPRTWRTRPVPFEGVWCEVLGWLTVRVPFVVSHQSVLTSLNKMLQARSSSQHFMLKTTLCQAQAFRSFLSRQSLIKIEPLAIYSVQRPPITAVRHGQLLDGSYRDLLSIAHVF